MVIEIENKTCYETIRQYFFENGKSSALFKVLKTAIQKKRRKSKTRKLTEEKEKQKDSKKI